MSTTPSKPARRRPRQEQTRQRPLASGSPSGRRPESGSRPSSRPGSPGPDQGDDAVARALQAKDQAPLLPGVKPVLEYLQSSPERVDTVFVRKGRRGKELERIVDLCRAGGVRFSLLDPASFARVYSGSSQGVVARLYEAGFVDVEDLLAGVMDAPLPLALVLDQVQDPGNAGTLARTLYALGGAGIILPRNNGVYLGGAAAKASAGALDRLPVAKAPSLAQALDSAGRQGFTIYGAAAGPAAGGADMASHAAGRVIDIFAMKQDALRFPALLALGGEEGGLRPGMEKRCDFLLRIPMLREFDSLNVAQAGGIILAAFAGSLQRKQG